MIGKILLGIIKLISSLITLILTPIDNLITSTLPGLSNVLNSFGEFFNLIGSGIGWVINAFALPTEIITLIVSYWVFKLTAPLIAYTIKFVLYWYDKLKP